MPTIVRPVEQPPGVSVPACERVVVACDGCKVEAEAVIGSGDDSWTRGLAWARALSASGFVERIEGRMLRAYCPACAKERNIPVPRPACVALG